MAASSTPTPTPTPTPGTPVRGNSSKPQSRQDPALGTLRNGTYKTDPRLINQHFSDFWDQSFDQIQESLSSSFLSAYKKAGPENTNAKDWINANIEIIRVTFYTNHAKDLFTQLTGGSPLENEVEESLIDALDGWLTPEFALEQLEGKLEAALAELQAREELDDSTLSSEVVLEETSSDDEDDSKQSPKVDQSSLSSKELSTRNLSDPRRGSSSTRREETNPKGEVGRKKKKASRASSENRSTNARVASVAKFAIASVLGYLTQFTFAPLAGPVAAGIFAANNVVVQILNKQSSRVVRMIAHVALAALQGFVCIKGLAMSFAVFSVYYSVALVTNHLLDFGASSLSTEQRA